MPSGTDRWIVQQLRISAFPVAGSTLVNSDSWWQSVTGVPPESTTSKPREGLVQSGGKIDDSTQLILSCLPDRIDWQLVPIPNETQSEIPTLGDFETSLPRFISVINSWLEMPSLEIHRLALGMNLVQPVEDRVSGYKTIAQYLPALELDPEGSSDFSYSINRPRKSTTSVDHLVINRLSKWSVIAFRMFRVPTQAQGSEQIIFTEKESNNCHLELDINTAPHKDVKKLPPEKTKEIFVELVALAKEIAEKGDVK